MKKIYLTALLVGMVAGSGVMASNPGPVRPGAGVQVDQKAAIAAEKKFLVARQTYLNMRDSPDKVNAARLKVNALFREMNKAMGLPVPTDENIPFPPE
jgi:hypothetical protein